MWVFKLVGIHTWVLTSKVRQLVPCHCVLLAFLFILCSYFANGQDQGEIEKVQIEIVKDRQITLQKAERNFEKVSPRPVEQIKPEITYSFKNIPFTTPNYNPAIRPLKLKSEPISKIYGNYISVGYGNYSSPFLEGYLTSKRNKNKFYGAKVVHHSFGKGPVDDSNSASGNTDIRLFGRTFNKSIQAGGSLAFENWSNKFYGNLPGVFKGNAASQSYTVFSANADIGNATNRDSNYKLNGGFSYLQDNFSSTENEIALSFTSDYKLSRENILIVNSDYVMMTRKYASTESLTRYILKIKPSFQFSPFNSMKLIVGVNTAFQNDTLGNVKSINIYPHVMANYSLSSSIQAFAGITGDVDKVTLQNLSRENSWLNQNAILNNTNRTFEFLGGLKGNLFNKMAFHTGFSIANLKNLYLYRNDLTNAERFEVRYDQGNTQRTNLFAELGYSSSSTKIKTLLRADYFNYSTDQEAAAWHRPTYRIAFTSSFNLNDKLLFDVDFVNQGGMKALAFDQQNVTTINAAVDLNFKLSYLVSSQFSSFIKLNNILASQYEVYQYYQVRGFQALVGLTWSF